MGTRIAIIQPIAYSHNIFLGYSHRRNNPTDLPRSYYIFIAATRRFEIYRTVCLAGQVTVEHFVDTLGTGSVVETLAVEC